MKSIKDLREQYELITEKEDKEQRKLTTLVRAGLFDAKKLPMLKRALDKGADKMTPAEKKILIDLLDSLMNQVISNEPVYMKVKRNVQSTNEEIIAEAVRIPTTISDVPSIVVLRRKAVRVYPGGQQVGLYYSQQLDKYVTIPFGEAGIAEEANLEEAKKRNKRFSTFGYTDKTDDDEDSEKKSDRQPRIMSKRYTDTTAKEREQITPGKVFTGHIDRGGSVADAAIMGLMARHFKKKYGKTYSPSATKKMVKQSLKKMSPERVADVKAERQQRSKRKPSFSPTTNTSKSPYKKSSATSGTMLSRMEESYKSKYKLVRKKQLDEYNMKDLGSDAADVFVPGVSAYKNFKKGNYGAAVGDLALDAASIGAGIISGGTGYAPARVATAGIKAGIKGSRLASKGAASSARQARRAKALERLQNARKKNKNAFRGKKKKGGSGLGTGLGLGAGLGSMGGGAGTSNQPNWKTPSVKSNREWENGVTKVGPQYSRGGADAPVDPATARRLQKQFYSKESKEITIGRNIFEINSNIADKFVSVYNSLSETNQEKMLNMMLNEETQNKVLEFVRRY